MARDLCCWTEALLFDADPKVAEPKALCYRLLHVAARIICHARRLILRLQRTWSWARQLPRGPYACAPRRCAVDTRLNSWPHHVRLGSPARLA